MIKYTGFEKQHRIMGFAIIGFFNKALELSGAKDAVIYFTTPIEEGKGYAELSNCVELNEALRVHRGGAVVCRGACDRNDGAFSPNPPPSSILMPNSCHSERSEESLRQPAARNPFYRPIKQQLTLRLDADVVAWLRRQGKGYQTRANALLRDAMLRDLRRKAS